MLCFAHTAEDSVVVQGQRNWLQRVCQFHYATLSLATMTSGKANLQMIKNSALCIKFFANFHFFCLFPELTPERYKSTAFHHVPIHCSTPQWNHLLYFTAISCYASIWSMKFSGNPHNYCCYTWNYRWPGASA
jgi:hypothetical protein